MGFFSVLHRVQIGSGAHPASYPMGTGVIAVGHEADHLTSSNAEVKNTWIYTSTLSHMSSWCDAY
jgi:hypothetical protein